VDAAAIAARVKSRIAATQHGLTELATAAAEEQAATGAYVRGTGPRPLFPGESSDEQPGCDRGDPSDAGPGAVSGSAAPA
jgi:hypothetical protein